MSGVLTTDFDHSFVFGEKRGTVLQKLAKSTFYRENADKTLKQS